MEPSERRSLNLAMARLADGDRGALGEVVTALWPVLRRFTGRLLDQDAEDAAQDALLKVMGQASDFDRGRDALSWALTIAAFEVKTYRKRQARRRQVGEGALANAAHPAPTADREMEARQLHEALAHALDGLAVGDREALMRSFDAEGPMAPVDRKRKQRALERLRGMWRRLHG